MFQIRLDVFEKDTGVHRALLLWNRFKRVLHAPIRRNLNDGASVHWLLLLEFIIFVIVALTWGLLPSLPVWGLRAISIIKHIQFVLVCYTAFGWVTWSRNLLLLLHSGFLLIRSGSSLSRRNLLTNRFLTTITAHWWCHILTCQQLLSLLLFVTGWSHRWSLLARHAFLFDQLIEVIVNLLSSLNLLSALRWRLRLAARRRGLLLSGRIDLLLFAANLNLGALNLFLHKHLILDCQSFTLMHLLGLKL